MEGMILTFIRMRGKSLREEMEDVGKGAKETLCVSGAGKGLRLWDQILQG